MSFIPFHLRRAYSALGKVAISYAQAVAAVGFTLVSRPVVNPFTGKQQANDVGVYRSDTHACLGIHCPGFTYLQPEQVLSVMEKARVQAGGEWSSIYLGEGGASLRAFVRLGKQLKAKNRGDKIGLSLALSEGWNGQHKSRINLCMEVLACTNGAVSRRSVVSFNSKHTGSIKDRFALFEGKLSYNLQLEIDEMQAQVSKLDATAMSVAEVEVFAKRLFGVSLTAKPEEIPAQTTAKVEAITTGFTRGLGNEGKTRWDAFNAVTEFLDWGANYRATDLSREENRFHSVFDGTGATIRDNALALLLA